MNAITAQLALTCRRLNAIADAQGVPLRLVHAVVLIGLFAASPARADDCHPDYQRCLDEVDALDCSDLQIPPKSTCKAVKASLAETRCNRLRNKCGAGSCRDDQCCSNGACVCPAGITECAGACRNLSSDVANCGSCGHRCQDNGTCQGSICGCARPLTGCAAEGCRDLANDVRDCGQCGNKCPAGWSCHAGICAMSTGVRPLDLFWTQTDPNGLPLNPDWVAHSSPIMVQSHHVDLHNASPACVPTRGNNCDATSDIACWRDYTSYSSLSEDIAVSCQVWCNHGGHLNWFPATYTGFVQYNDYSARGPVSTFVEDDDTNFNFWPKDADFNDLDSGMAGRDYLHCEMSSIETINQFQSGWWLAFHDAVHESRDAATALVPGNRAILIGLVGFDMQHGIHTELHPIYALAIEIDGNPLNNRWAIFTRNWGNEGACSRSNEHPLAMRDIILSIPGPIKTKPTGVKENARDFRTDGSNTAVSDAYFIDNSAYIDFELGDPGDKTEVNGTITLQWTLPPGASAPPRPVAPLTTRSASPLETEQDQLPGSELLTPAQLQQLKAALPPTPTRDKSRDMLVPKRVPFRRREKPAAAVLLPDVVTADPAKEKTDLQTVQTLCAMLNDHPQRPPYCSQLQIPPPPTVNSPGCCSARGTAGSPRALDYLLFIVTAGLIARRRFATRRVIARCPAARGT